MGSPVHAPQLTCPAGGLPALKAAVDYGADCVYVGFRDQTDARAFSGLNFDPATLREGIAYAHRRGRKVLIALNPYWNGVIGQFVPATLRRESGTAS